MPELIHRLPHVAILLAGSQVSFRQILRGILRYAQVHTPWTLDVRVGRDGEPASFDEASSSWVTERGRYTFIAAKNAADRGLRKKVRI